MKFLAERETLLDGLAKLIGVIDGKSGVPILRNVLMDTWASAVRLRATDTEIDLALSCPAEISEQGQITVDGKLLHEIVRKCPKGGQIAFALKDNIGQLQLVSGAAKFKLATLPPDDFPVLQIGAEFCGMRMESRQLRALIEKTQFAISRDETRYYLGGILFHALDEKLVAVATDGHRLARKTMALPAGGAGLTGQIVPRESAAAMLKILPDSEAECELAIAAKLARLIVGETELTTKLIDGSFPDYQRVIPSGSAGRAALPLAGVAEAAARVATILDDKSDALALEFGGDRLRIYAHSAAFGHSGEEVLEDCSCDAPPCRVGVNARYLGDALAALGGAQFIMALQAEPGSPLVLEEVDGDGSMTIVLMPIRLKDAGAQTPARRPHERLAGLRPVNKIAANSHRCKACSRARPEDRA